MKRGLSKRPASATPKAGVRTGNKVRGTALPLADTRMAETLQAIRAGDVDALFVPDGQSGWIFTLDGADRAYRLLIEDMSEGALMLTPEGSIAYANRRFAALVDRPLNQIIGTAIADCFAPEARGRLMSLVAEGQHVKRSGELDLLTHAGVRVPTFLSVSPLLADGMPAALCLVVTDLTQQRHSDAVIEARASLQALVESQRATEASLRESLATLRLLDACVANLNDIVLITEAEPFDEPGPRIVFVNDAFTRLTGYSREEVIGRTPRLLQGPKTDRKVLDVVSTALRRWEPLCVELVNYAKDGTEFWIEMQIVPVANAAGWFTHWVAIERDVSARKSAEAARASLENQVREAQKMEAIGTLAGGIAHDFNNILGAILGNVALAQLDLPAGHPALNRLTQIAMSGARARNLVEQILTFSRQEPLVLKPQLLNEIVSETELMLRATLPSAVKLTVVMIDKPLHVQGDATQLQQVLLNLCTNAWHALPGGAGTVAVRLSIGAPRGVTGRYAHLAVIDSGAGMDATTQARVFEPFFTTKPSGQGTGLGLSVVHGIVASHGGVITLSSLPGHGSLFDVYFPLVDEDDSSTALAPLAKAPTHGSGQHVLYIDDDEVMLVMVEELLRNWGYRATCLADPVAAIAAVKAGPTDFDVAISDFNMPQMSGLDVALALREIDAKLPVVISSGFISEQVRIDALNAGVVALLRKEHTLAELGAVVAKALERGR